MLKGAFAFYLRIYIFASSYACTFWPGLEARGPSIRGGSPRTADSRTGCGGAPAGNWLAGGAPAEKLLPEGPPALWKREASRPTLCKRDPGRAALAKRNPDAPTGFRTEPRFSPGAATRSGIPANPSEKDLDKGAFDQFPPW